jgi:hypothetical protein
MSTIRNLDEDADPDVAIGGALALAEGVRADESCRVMRRLFVVAFAVLLAGCPDRPAGPAPPAPPAPPQPAGAKVSGRIEAAGGTIALPDGTRVVFPPNAVAGATEFTVARTELAGREDGRTIARIECEPGASFAAPVELQLPLSPDATPGDEGALLVAQVGAAGTYEVVPSTIEVVDGRPRAVAFVRHFSSCDFIFDSAFETARRWADPPPESCEPIQIPFYRQGVAPECVPASLEMAVKAVRPDRGPVWELMADAKLSGGISNLGAKFDEDLRQALHDRIGVTPLRIFWSGPCMTAGLGNLVLYYQRTLAAGRPIVVLSTLLTDRDRPNSGHCVVLVGYDPSGFWVQNPQGKAGAGGLRPCGPEHVSRDAFLGALGIKGASPSTGTGLRIARMGISDAVTTIELPKPPTPLRSRVTINAPPADTWFEAPAGHGVGTSICALWWDGKAPGGTRWFVRPGMAGKNREGEGETVDAIPPEMTRLRIGCFQGDPNMGPLEPTKGLEVANTYPKHPVEAVVTLAIRNMTARKLVASPPPQRVRVPGEQGQAVAFTFDDVDRWLDDASPSPQEFLVEAAVNAGNNDTDALTFRFKLERSKAGFFRIQPPTHEPRPLPGWTFDSSPGAVRGALRSGDKETRYELTWDALPSKVPEGTQLKFTARCRLDGDVMERTTSIDLDVGGSMWEIKPAWHKVSASARIPVTQQEFTIVFPRALASDKTVTLPPIELRVNIPNCGSDTFTYPVEWVPPRR